MSSVNSLSNFGVPGLNGDRAPVLQPVLSNRFRATFYNFGASSEPAPYDMTRQVRRFTRPNVSFDVQPIWTYVSPVYISTRAEIQEVNVVFLDDITNSVMRRVENQKSKQQNFNDQTLARSGSNYKFEMDLDILAGGTSAGQSASDPNILQKWCFSGCQIVSADYGEMNYDNANPVEINTTIRCDNVIGFDQFGNQMGTYSHSQEIQSQSGVSSTGVGGSSGVNISVSGASVSVGGVTFGGSTSTDGDGAFNISF